MNKKEKKTLVDEILHEQFLVGQLEGARSFLDIIPDDLVDNYEEIESGYAYTEKVQNVLKQIDELVRIRLVKIQKLVDELIEDE